MTAIALNGDKRMTVQEIADALGYEKDYLRKKVKELFPETVVNGKETMLDEKQVFLLKQNLVPRTLDMKVQGENALTALDIEEMTIKVITYHKAEAERLRAENQILKPKAETYDRISNATGLRLLSEVGKITGIGPKKIFTVFAEKGFIFKRRGSWLPRQDLQDAGFFQTKDRLAWTDGEGVEHMEIQLYVTPKGELWIAKQLFIKEAV
jgi:phage antirepressor YoqD-like protein